MGSERGAREAERRMRAPQEVDHGARSDRQARLHDATKLAQHLWRTAPLTPYRNPASSHYLRYLEHESPQEKREAAARFVGLEWSDELWAHACHLVHSFGVLSLIDLAGEIRERHRSAAFEQRASRGHLQLV